MKQYMASCDTLGVLGKYTKSGQNLFAKNSDRDAAEAQLLKYFPAEDHPNGSKQKCTYIEVLQVPHTYAMIGSQPWWIWGFEHGVNEWGVAIGNEAEWSTVGPLDEDLLLGMDIIRLALERSKTAKEAVDVITFMIEIYGQGGACRYQYARADYNYHNSFLVTDKNDCYLVETCQRQWAVKKIEDYKGISNVYSLEDDYDSSSERIREFALENGVYQVGTPLNFSKSFQLMLPAKCSGYPRAQRSNKLLKEKEGQMDVAEMSKILRDHYEGEIIENRYSPASTFVPTICMHCSDGGSQTAASMIVDYHDSIYPELYYTCWCSMAPACTSILVPYYNTGFIPEKLGIGTNKYSEDSFWWKMKRLNVAIESDYTKYAPVFRKTQEELEKQFLDLAQKKEVEARLLLDLKKKEEARKVLNEFSVSCLEKVEETVDRFIEEFENDLLENKNDQIYRAPFLRQYKMQVGMGTHKKIR